MGECTKFGLSNRRLSSGLEDVCFRRIMSCLKLRESVADFLDCSSHLKAWSLESGFCPLSAKRSENCTLRFDLRNESQRYPSVLD